VFKRLFGDEQPVSGFELLLGVAARYSGAKDDSMQRKRTGRCCTEHNHGGFRAAEGTQLKYNFRHAPEVVSPDD
jgi:hypothetical protein